MQGVSRQPKLWTQVHSTSRCVRVQGMNWDDDERIRLINLLNSCVKLTELGNFNAADVAFYHLSHLASPDGDSMQRVATCFIEALAYCQVAKNLRGVPKVLHLWTNLIKCLKPSTPTCPKITITAIHEKKEVLEKMGLHLGVEAQRLLFPFQFNPVVSSLENLDPETLPIKKGEPLAISSVLQLHSLLASDDDDEMAKM
ncbi:Scarecrow-like protein 3 [Glycine soja]|uniref:Scarecrow-like protein 3 n=2 Tax=Glycine soja TaxID=3848 RepID=A0A445HIX0_GLYSO|nr:Scarecrow-like protein 3 [Glycine soja]